MRIVISILLISMVLNSSAKAQEIPKATNPYGGTLVWGTSNKPAVINPILTTSSVSMSLIDLIFDSLIRISSQGQIESNLAKSWNLSNKSSVYTFSLRDNVGFHDGRECTTDDVEFTFKRILDQKINSPFRSSLQLVEDIRVIDKYTFQILLKEPSASFLYRLTNIKIVPKHLLEKADLRTCFFNVYPVGTGPFRFQKWSEDNHIVLSYNPDYYEGRPYLNRILIKTYANSQDVWTALMRGEVDYMEFIEKENYEILKSDPAFSTFSFPADYYYALIYNLDDSIMNDERIRQAIAYAIDRKNLIKRVVDGYGEECFGPFSPSSLGFNPKLEPFEYNPQKALQILSKGGWQDKNNNGILEKEGEELELKVLIDERNNIYNKIIMIIRQQLQEIGIKVTARLYNDDAILTREFLEREGIQAHIRLSLGGMDPDLAMGYWSSKESKRKGKLWVYKNEEVDRLIDLGRIVQDEEKRGEMYQKIAQLIHEEQPACFLYYPYDFHAISSKFENVDQFFNVNMPYYTMKNWYKGE